MNKLYRLVCSFVSVVGLVFSAYADGVEAGMQYFDDVRGDTPIVTNAWANVSNKVHSLIQVVSPKTDISGKQDKLPYPTNAIPYDVLKDVPVPSVISNENGVIFSNGNCIEYRGSEIVWVANGIYPMTKIANNFYRYDGSGISLLLEFTGAGWILEEFYGGERIDSSYISGEEDYTDMDFAMSGSGNVYHLEQETIDVSVQSKLSTTNDVAQMISGKADEISDWSFTGNTEGFNLSIEHQNGQYILKNGSVALASLYSNEDALSLKFTFFYGSNLYDITATRKKVLRTGDAATLEQLSTKQDKLPYPTNNIPVSAVNGAVDDSQIATINHRIDTIEMSSRPNINVVGSPIFSQGNVSGFSANDYLIFPSNVSVGTNTVVFNMRFTTGDDITTKQNILDSAYGLAFAISNGYTITYISYDGNSFIPSRSETAYIAPNTSYNLRLIFKKVGGNYFTETYVGTNISNMPKRGSSIQTGVPLVAKPTYWGGANPITGIHNIFKGTINLNECNLWFNDVRVWSGYDVIQNDYVSFDPTADRVLNTAEKIVNSITLDSLNAQEKLPYSSGKYDITVSRANNVDWGNVNGKPTIPSNQSITNIASSVVSNTTPSIVSNTFPNVICVTNELLTIKSGDNIVWQEEDIAPLSGMITSSTNAIASITNTPVVYQTEGGLKFYSGAKVYTPSDNTQITFDTNGWTDGAACFVVYKLGDTPPETTAIILGDYPMTGRVQTATWRIGQQFYINSITNAPYFDGEAQ